MHQFDHPKNVLLDGNLKYRKRLRRVVENGLGLDEKDLGANFCGLLFSLATLSSQRARRGCFGINRTFWFFRSPLL